MIGFDTRLLFALLSVQLCKVDAFALISDCNGVSYNSYVAICCDGIVSYAVSGYYYGDCCDGSPFSLYNHTCCSGTIVEGYNVDCSSPETTTNGSGGSGGSAGSSLDYTCYPNGTVEVTNPNPGTFTDVMAVQNEGLSAATKCSVSSSGATVLLTSCSQDLEITVFFSDRQSGDDDVFVGQATRSFSIQCDNIADTGIDRTVSNLLGATLEVTTQDSVTPSFTVSSALRSGSQTGTEVYSGIVGDQLYWTIDIPSDYNGMPTCTAYSGSSNSGSPSKELVSNGLVAGKRAIAEKSDSTDMVFKTGQVLHILPDGGISAAPGIGGPVALLAVVTTTLIMMS